MNLFVCEISESGVNADALRMAFATFLSELPFFPQDRLRIWQSPASDVAVACVAHLPSQLGDVEPYWFEDGRMTLFAGRPILWKPDGEADGRALLDPRCFLDDTATWKERLDGRCAIIRHDGRVLDVVTDPLGSYPIYSSESEATRWLGNNVELLRRVAGQESRNIDLFALASFVGCGYSLGGGPLTAGVQRIPRGISLRYAQGSWTQTETLSTERVGEMFRNRGPDSSPNHVLVSASRALGDWPGRPIVVSVTGGRDSRLVFAAALQSGLSFQARTIADPAKPGYPVTPDVAGAAKLCEIAGVAHAVTPRAPIAELDARLRIFGLVSPGTVALSELGRIETRASENPVEIDLGGQGGELARVYYGDATRAESDEEVARSLVARLLGRWPPTLLNDDGRRMITAYVSTWVAEQRARGIDRSDLPDVFYLLERLGSWAAQIGAVGEYWRDAASPLWTAAFLPHAFGAPHDERAHGRFHLQVLAALEPQFVDVPFTGANSWWASHRLARVAHRALEESARRARARLRFSRALASGQADFHELHALLCAWVEEGPYEDCWNVIDRGRVRRLLAQNPIALNSQARQHVYRLASVFLLGSW